MNASVTLPNMKDNPDQLASHLIEQHGVDGALEAAREGIAAAHASGDNYSLSVWREVRRALREEKNAAEASPEL